ncbi:MAG: cupin domain-containing protein [Lentisphaeraceae bacterium]|nr:cupin domain-containing protein [Lentisphaeraceae bacterium]
MNTSNGNLFSDIPTKLKKELFEVLFKNENLKIERIVSEGHSSPEQGWYDQAESEWVVVVEGSAKILFDDDREFLLETGDYLNIPAHTKHKVVWTDPDKQTIWLAIHYS